MFGWLRLASRRGSLSSSPKSRFWRCGTLIATFLSIQVSSARYTLPNPPLPSDERIWYLPMVCPGRTSRLPAVYQSARRVRGRGAVVGAPNRHQRRHRHQRGGIGSQRERAQRQRQPARLERRGQLAGSHPPSGPMARATVAGRGSSVRRSMAGRGAWFPPSPAVAPGSASTMRSSASTDRHASPIAIGSATSGTTARPHCFTELTAIGASAPPGGHA